MLKIKFLWIGLFLASPPMAAWALRGDKEAEPTAMKNSAETTPLKVPVEVLATGEKAEWVMVEVNHDAIPEPGSATLLLAFSTMLLLRRHRGEE